MLSRLLTNLAMLVMVIMLGVFVYIAQDAQMIDLRLTTVDPNSITHIEIRYGDRDVKFDKAGDHWKMLAPISVDANDFRINTLLGLLSTERQASYDAGKLALDVYGLDAPDTSISFNDTTIAFGIDNPINHNRYVMIDRHVYLISDQFYPLISSQLGTLVSQSLLPRDAIVSKIILPEQTLVKTDTGWRSDDDSVSTDAIVATVDHWQHSQAFGVHDYNPRDSLGTIEVSLEGVDEPLRFEITDTDPWLIIARPALGLEYHFDLDYYDRLLRPGASKELPDELKHDPDAAKPPLQPL